MPQWASKLAMGALGTLLSLCVAAALYSVRAQGAEVDKVEERVTTVEKKTAVVETHYEHIISDLKEIKETLKELRK
jgi:hypothetical protein